MSNYIEFGRTLFKYLPPIKGATQEMKLSAEALKELHKTDEFLTVAIRDLTEEHPDAIIEVTQRMKGNYGIAAFNIKSGDKVITRGAYSQSTNSALASSEKMHVEHSDKIVRVEQEAGTVREQYYYPNRQTNPNEIVEPKIKPAENKGQVTEKVIKSTQEIVDEMLKKYKGTLEGLNSENIWMRKDLMSLSKEQLQELNELLDIAKQKGVKIPYDRKTEYLEMSLPMTDGRLHRVKIFPRYYEGNVNMRMFLDDDIPNATHKTLQEVFLDDKIFSGTIYKLAMPPRYMSTANGMTKDWHSLNILDRIKAHMSAVEAIEKNWAQTDAEWLIRDYEIDMGLFLKHNGKLHSPLKPRDIIY